MGKVQRGGRVKLVRRHVLQSSPRRDILAKHLFDLFVERLLVAFAAAEDVIEDLRDGFVLVFMPDNAVAALTQVVRRRVRRCLQRRYGLRLLVPAACAGQRLILKYEKEPPRNGLRLLLCEARVFSPK